MPFYKEEKGEFTPAKASEIPPEAIFAIERADEQSIVEHMTSEFASSNFIYSYPIKGGQVVGIGIDGAKEIARLQGNIEVLPDIRIDKDSDPDYIYAMVRAKDLIRNVTMMGVGRQCKYIVGENWQPTDRVDETAFVKAVNKGMRNAILALPPQEAIAKIVDTFMEQKRFKKLPPSASKPAPARAATAKAVTEEDIPKKLRQQIAIEWSKTGKKEPERKDWQKTEYGVDSMAQLNEEQLNDMLMKVKAMQPSLSDLGFASKEEQDQLRKTLYNLLKETGHDTDEKIRDYLSGKEIVHTRAISKKRFEELIGEVEKEKATIEKAESIPEEL